MPRTACPSPWPTEPWHGWRELRRHHLDESTTGFHRRVRLATYRHFLDAGGPPSPADLAATLACPPDDVTAAWQQLAAERVLVLDPATGAIRMAMPFAAQPTGFRVETERGAWWGNCAWDALGISAMLAQPARIETACGDCAEPIVIKTDGQALVCADGVVHFAVPARHWWDDIGFT